MTSGSDGIESYSEAHATTIVVGVTGVMIRGASGSGKSHLAALLIAEARRRGLFGRLVGDDRTRLSASAGRLVASGHPIIAGLIERRGEGIVKTAFEPACVIRCIIDLSRDLPPRLPDADQLQAELLGVTLRRLVLPAGITDAAGVLDRLLARQPA